MKLPTQVDVHHGAEALAGHAQRGRHEVAGGAGDQHVDGPEGLACGGQDGLDGLVLAHVGAVPAHLAAVPAQLLDGGGHALDRAAGDGHTGAALCEGLGNGQVDAAAAAGNEDVTAGEIQQFAGEWGGHAGKS